MSDDLILSAEEVAANLDDLRIAGVTDRVTASCAEVAILGHDLALRREVARLREAAAEYEQVGSTFLYGDQRYWSIMERVVEPGGEVWEPVYVKRPAPPVPQEDPQ